MTPPQPRAAADRRVDMQIIGEWVEPGSRVLDLGCGRGVLLEYLIQSKGVFGVGVDLDFQKVLGCVRRGVNAYQGDLNGFMKAFPDKFFDRVICSRTVQELSEPAAVIFEALRLAGSLTVGFVNHAFWKNRVHACFRGRKIVNEVYPTEWYASRPSNPVSIRDFEHFCRTNRIRIVRRVHLAGNWKDSCAVMPNLFAGYALYDLQREGS